MLINSNTKIASLLKFHPDTLEAIISISPSFEKLRNPFLRKLMAGRTSIATASKISKCNIEDFYTKLEPLGFKIDRNTNTNKKTKLSMPAYIANLKPDQIITLDVRPILSGGVDPLVIILATVKKIQTDQALKIINTFEPIPLIKLLEKKGFISHTEFIGNDTTETYMYKSKNVETADNTSTSKDVDDWDLLIDKYKNKTQIVDVRELDMPLPMVKILEALEELKPNNALFVFHKKVPVFLIPELHEKNISYRIKEINEHEIHLLIFKE
jgi:uncharacterized protein (DUF2249 family)